MHFNVATVVLLVLITISSCNANFLVIETYSDASCSNETFVARFVTSDSAYYCAINRRATAAPCSVYQNVPGVYYYVDYSYCTSSSEPTLYDAWQSVRVTSDPSCNYTEVYSSKIEAPKSLQNETVVIYHPVYRTTVAYTSLSCSALGVQSFSTCVDGGDELNCFDFTLENDICTVNTGNATYAIQTTCVAAPAAPVADNEPIYGPAPVAVPAKTPTDSKTSKASLVLGSLSLSLLTLI